MSKGLRHFARDFQTDERRRNQCWQLNFIYMQSRIFSEGNHKYVYIRISSDNYICAEENTEYSLIFDQKVKENTDGDYLDLIRSFLPLPINMRDIKMFGNFKGKSILISVEVILIHHQSLS